MPHLTDAQYAARRNRVAIALLLLLSGLIDLWDLSVNRWANAFYSGAAQAGAQSWHAWLFGASDPQGAISVDKIPAALWFDGLSVRLFGLHTWSLLLPQALMGMACVVLVHVTVRRVAGVVGGLVAGITLALTPVAAEMFRYNNPDAFLVLLMTASVWALIRALEKGSTRWLVAVGILTGTAFLAKMLQGVLLAPVLAGVYLLAAPVAMGRRVRQLIASAAGMVAAAGWYVVLVELTPSAHRPYVSSTLHNSIVELTLGYNGFGRLTGAEIPAWLVGDAATGRVSAAPGPSRLFTGELGTQASWLIPTAVLLGALCLVLTARRARTDPLRAQALAWGGWLLVVGGVLSQMRGIVHAYYAVAVAPAVAALAGLGAGVVWQHRRQPLVLGGCALSVLLGAGWSVSLLRLAPGFHPWLKYLVVLLALGAVAMLVVHAADHASRSITLAGVLALLALSAGPASFTAYTVRRPSEGATVVAGPRLHGELDRRAMLRPQPGRGYHGNIENAVVSPALRAQVRASTARWPVASVGATTAALFQLGTGRAALAIGGYTGLDPYPSLPAYQRMVRDRQLGYLYISTGPADVAVRSPRSQAYAIYAWTRGHCRLVRLDTSSFFDLSTCTS